MSEKQLTEVNDAAPTSLKHMVGQRSVVEQVAVAIDAAFADDKKFDHALLVGPSGCGKTQTAKIIAAEMATELHEMLGQSITCPADFNSVLLAAKDRDILFVDECHELSKEFQTALFLALDQRRLILAGGRSARGVQSIPLGDFTLLVGDDRRVWRLRTSPTANAARPAVSVLFGQRTDDRAPPAKSSTRLVGPRGTAAADGSTRRAAPHASRSFCCPPVAASAVPKGRPRSPPIICTGPVSLNRSTRSASGQPSSSTSGCSPRERVA